MHDLVVMPVNRWESKSTGLFILFEAKRVYHVSHCNKHLMGDAVNIMRGKGGGLYLPEHFMTPILGWDYMGERVTRIKSPSQWGATYMTNEPASKRARTCVIVAPTEYTTTEPASK